MVQRFIAWWIRNAVYIGPVATCLSALAALLSVYMVTKTFRQNREDRLEELEAKRPKFRISGALITNMPVKGAVPGEILQHYVLSLTLKNSKANHALYVKVAGRVYGLEELDPWSEFKHDLVEEIHEDETTNVSINLEAIAITKPHFVRVELKYDDGRTRKHYEQKLYRFFQSPYPHPTELPLRELTAEDLERFTQTQLALIDKKTTELIMRLDERRERASKRRRDFHI